MLAAVCVAAGATEQQSKRIRRARTRLPAEFNHTLASLYLIKVVRLGKKKHFGWTQKFTTEDLGCAMRIVGIRIRQEQSEICQQKVQTLTKQRTNTNTRTICVAVRRLMLRGSRWEITQVRKQLAPTAPVFANKLRRPVLDYYADVQQPRDPPTRCGPDTIWCFFLNYFESDLLIQSYCVQQMSHINIYISF